MKKHRLKAIIVGALLLSLLFGAVACAKKEEPVAVDEHIKGLAASAAELTYSTGVNDSAEYDDTIFYRNDFSLFDVGPDPTMFYHDGYYYLYHTSSGRPIASYRTKNFAEWEYMGVAYNHSAKYSAGEIWANGLYWAPEAFEWQGKFYMYVTVSATQNPDAYPEGLEYIGAAARDRNLSNTQIETEFGISTSLEVVQTMLLVSDKPEGPFEPWTGERTVQEYYHGEKVGAPKVQTVTGNTVPFFDFADAPEAWETNKFFFDTTVDREKYEQEYGSKVFWDSNIFATLDSAPFVDEDGTLYLMVVRSGDHQPDATGKGRGNCIWICRMFDPATPDYSSFTQLTQSRRLTVGGEYTYGNATTEGTMDGNVNEGPFMVMHKTRVGDKVVKKYYLTYSGARRATANENGYNVALAVGDSPMGPFTKLDEKYGNPLYMISPEYGDLPATAWSHGSGHGTLFTAGGETFIVAHSMQNNATVGVLSERQPLIDRIVWAYDEELGYDVPHANGPSKNTLQPQPFTATGYKNIAPEATVTATNMSEESSVAYINDDYRVIHERDDSRMFRSKTGGTTITLDFGEPRTVRGVMVYNSRDMQFAFSKIDSIVFENGDDVKVIRDLKYPEWGLVEDGLFIAPGGSAVAEFAEIKAQKISFVITEKYPDYQDRVVEGVDNSSTFGIKISDIVVLGKAEGSDFTAPATYDESKFYSSHMLDLSNADPSGNRLTIDRDKLDISGNHGSVTSVTYDEDGTLHMAKGLAAPFKHESETNNGFVVTTVSEEAGTTYNASWNNGAIAVYTGSEGRTNLQYRIFIVKRSATEMRVVFNHFGAPWAERYYPFEYETNDEMYRQNGWKHRLTVAYLDGVYYIAFTPFKSDGTEGETRVIRIDRNTPFVYTAGRSYDTSALFNTGRKVIGFATIDQPDIFTDFSYDCSDDAARRAIAGMTAHVYGNEPQNGQIVLAGGNDYCLGETVPVEILARNGYALSDLRINGAAVDIEAALADGTMTEEEDAGGVTKYVYYLKIDKAKTYSLKATFAEVE